MINQELAGRVLEAVLEHPEQHDQRHWEFRPADTACGTTRCVAGWTLHLEGVELEHFATTRSKIDGTAGMRLVDRSDYYLTYEIFGGGQQIHDLAQNLLGLNEAEANLLFSACLPEDEAVRTLKHIADTGEFPSHWELQQAIDDYAESTEED